MKHTRFLVFCLLAAVGASASAQTFYVDAVNGDNGNSGTSWGDAWQTISWAAVNATAPDIAIAPGLYDGTLGETFPIPLGHFTYRGVAGPAATVVDGGGADVIFEGSQYTWYGGGTLEGLTVRNGVRGVDLDVFCFMEWCTSELTLRDVVVSGMSEVGIYAGTWTDWWDAELDVVMERVVLEQNGTAVRIDAFCDPNHPYYPATAYASLMLSDSLIRDNGSGVHGDGFGYNESIGLDIHRCTFVGNAGAALGAGWNAHGSVRGCVFWGNGVDGSGDLSFEYCDTEHGLMSGTGNLSEDPLFLDATNGDYRLTFVSPCVDAGHPGEPESIDLAGTPRPLDGDLDTDERVDLGAYELAPLALDGEPRIGTTVNFELWGPPGGPSILYWRRGETQTPIPTPYGVWFLARPRQVWAATTTDVGPPHLHPFTILADPSLVGLTLSYQALSTSGHTSPPVTFTNPLTFTLEE